MDIKDKHEIGGKWIDCKRSVSVNEMKEIKKETMTLNS
jgi:hypothetical protein